MRIFFFLSLLCALTACLDEPNETAQTKDAGTTDAAQEDPELVAWAERVDSYWGEAPAVDVRLSMFDDVWDKFSQTYACFDSYGVDWDQTRAEYRPKVEAADSYGRFFQLMRAMLDQLHDPHSPLLSSKVCRVPLATRPPLVRNLDVVPVVGGCVTLDDNDELFVYRTATSEANALGLEVGDIIVGFDDKTWQENLADINRWKLPECDEDFAAAPVSAQRRRATVVTANGHLFETIEVKRYLDGQVESLPTSAMIEDRSSILVCGDQLPQQGGITQPVQHWSELDYNSCSNCVSYGLLEGTQIGFISVYGWYGDALADFANAVDELWDTEALIIDQRLNLGGVVPFIDYGFPKLFDQDINPLVSFYKRDPAGGHNDLVLDYDAWLDADESTYYDHPIAVLTGPKSGSAGDLCPYLLSHHPRARLFGRATCGAFGELQPVWYPQDSYINDFSLKVTRAQMVSADGQHLNAWELAPDQEVWLTKEDAVNGVDTILTAALDWIAQENGD